MPLPSLAHLSTEERRFLKLRGLVWPIRLGALAVLFVLLVQFGVLR